MLSEPNLIIQHWETASSNLVSALATFLESSLALEGSYIDPASEKYLSTKIERQWDFINALARRQIRQARTSIGRTRNRITPAIHRLPKEILARIFTSIAYLPRYKSGPFLRLKAMYRNINTLGRVCLAWRNLILSRSDFWASVPITDKGRSPEKMAQICFQRAGHNQNIHLVALFSRNDGGDQGIGSVKSLLQRMITPHPQRIRTLNLSAYGSVVVTEMIDCLINYCAPGSITELSISLFGRQRPVIFPPDSAQQALFNTFLEPLCVLRLSGISLSAGALSFSRLRELRLYEVDVLPQGALVQQLLPAVAPNLHILQIAYREVFMPDTQNPNGREFNEGAGPISFPSLQALCLLDLPLQALKALLQLIAPGSYRIILHPTLSTLVGGIPQDMQLILQERNVSELSLCFLAESLCRFLETFPSITTLHVHEVPLDRHGLSGLTSPPESHFVDRGANFPRLRELYLNDIRIEDQDAFKAMISSHPIERLHMGGATHAGDELAVWLRSTIPIIDQGYSDDGHPFHVAELEKWDFCV